MCDEKTSESCNTWQRWLKDLDESDGSYPDPIDFYPCTNCSNF